MFLEHLKIVEGNENVVRDIHFKDGLNIILDESTDDKGNNVGKTTFLKLIDICLGAKDKKYIWTDNDTGSETAHLKEYIHQNKVYVELALVKSGYTHFLKVELFDRGKRYIDGVRHGYIAYIEKLNEIIFEIQKPPTFRQLINKFVRIKQKIDNNTTLKYLDQNTSTREYRNIYEFLFKLDSLENSAIKLEISENIKKLSQDLDNLFRLHQFKNIEDLKERKRIVEISVNELQSKIDLIINTSKYNKALKEVTIVKNSLNLLSDSINGALFKKTKMEKILSNEQLINDKIDEELLSQFFIEIKKDLSGISKDFAELMDFNNKIKKNKINYYHKRISEIEHDIYTMQLQRDKLTHDNKEIINLINEDNYEEFDKNYNELLKQSEKSGELKKVKSIYKNLTDQLIIEEDKLSDAIKNSSENNNLEVFNKFFTKYSQEILNQRLYTYQNNDFPINLSNVDDGIGTGHRKTITLLIDIAYVSFITELKLNYPKFIVHDVLETVDEHNFNKLVNIIRTNGTQFIFGILNEKIKNYSFISEEDKILKLSKDNKLFRI